jgi:hypothetical protein
MFFMAHFYQTFLIRVIMKEMMRQHKKSIKKFHLYCLIHTSNYFIFQELNLFNIAKIEYDELFFFRCE